eukprot:Pgem_evm1s12807
MVQKDQGKNIKAKFKRIEKWIVLEEELKKPVTNPELLYKQTEMLKNVTDVSKFLANAYHFKNHAAQLSKSLIHPEMKNDIIVQCLKIKMAKLNGLNNPIYEEKLKNFIQLMRSRDAKSFELFSANLGLASSRSVKRWNAK